MRSLYALTFLVVFIAKGMAQDDFQPGYIVSPSGDTLRGLVQTSPGKDSDLKIEFKAEEGGSEKVYDAAVIAGFGFSDADRYFESFKLPGGNEKVFAEMLVDGKVDLYVYDDLFYLQTDTVRERIDRVQMRESNQSSGRYVYEHKTYIGTLNRHFSDCLPTRLLRGEVAYREQDFVDVFRKYSECSGAEFRVYKSLPQKRRIRYYALIGLNNSHLVFHEADLNIFKRDNNFFFGVGIIIPLVFLGENVFLTGEATYHQNSYRGKREGFTPAGAVQKNYTMQMSLIKIPLGVKVDLSRTSFRPYLSGGLTPFIPLSTSWTIAYQGATEARYDIRDRSVALVYWAGLGFEIKIGNKSVFTALRVEKFTDFIDFYGPTGAADIPSGVLNKMLVFGFNF